MEKLCQCELTGVIEIIGDRGCELCEGGQEITIESLKSALLFTKQQLDETNHKLKHPKTPPIVWRIDWNEAPKDGVRFLVLKSSGGEARVSTACFYWYTEDDAYWSPVAYWGLQDVVADEPLDEDGPAELQGLKWAPFPGGS